LAALPVLDYLTKLNHRMFARVVNAWIAFQIFVITRDSLWSLLMLIKSFDRYVRQAQ